MSQIYLFTNGGIGALGVDKATSQRKTIRKIENGNSYLSIKKKNIFK